MLNIAGPEYDFGTVVFTVLQECEHRRRSLDDEDFAEAIRACAAEKLEQIHKAYEEFGGSAAYWNALEKEVLSNVIARYSDGALAMNRLERTSFDTWRNADLGARLTFALVGLVVGSIIIALPFIPIVEDMFAFAMTFGGFIYPDLKRYLIERRWARQLNDLINESAAYQQNANLHYMTAEDIKRSLEPAAPRQLGGGT